LFASRVWLAVVAATVVAVAMAACTTGPGTIPPAGGATQSTSSAAPSTSSTTAATATTTDDDLAIAAAQKYYEAFERAIATRDTSVFRATFTVACRLCKDDAALIDAARASGQTFEGGRFTVTGLHVTSRPQPNRILVRGLVASTPITVRDATGKVLQKSDGGTGTKDFSVWFSDGVWRIEALTS